MERLDAAAWEPPGAPPQRERERVAVPAGEEADAERPVPADEQGLPAMPRERLGRLGRLGRLADLQADAAAP